MLITEFNIPNTKPNVNINLISPPPIDSLLKIISPKILIKYIITKATNPYKIDDNVLLNPFLNNNSNINNISPIINISSHIIIYL